MSFLQVIELYKSYGNVEVLKGVDRRVAAGDIVSFAFNMEKAVLFNPSTGARIR